MNKESIDITSNELTNWTDFGSVKCTELFIRSFISELKYNDNIKK